jgi:hypothetical protein
MTLQIIKNGKLWINDMEGLSTKTISHLDNLGLSYLSGYLCSQLLDDPDTSMTDVLIFISRNKAKIIYSRDGIVLKQHLTIK